MVLTLRGQTDLPNFTSKNPSSRRRFQDFTFLRDHLTRDFPAAVVPPLPDKHRLGELLWVAWLRLILTALVHRVSNWRPLQS